MIIMGTNKANPLFIHIASKSKPSFSFEKPYHAVFRQKRRSVMFLVNLSHMVQAK